MASRSAISSSNDEQKKDFTLKVLVIGELATGKTAVVKRYVHNSFTKNYKSTIGVDFGLKLVKYGDDKVVRLQLWDIAGQERFGNMTRVYYKEAVGCIIVYDVTRSMTLDAVSKWKADLDNKVQLPDGNRVPCILLGNKCDLLEDGSTYTDEQMDNYCREKGIDQWFHTSAKDNTNIESSIKYLIDKIMEQTTEPKRQEKPTFPTSPPSPPRSTCCK